MTFNPISAKTMSVVVAAALTFLPPAIAFAQSCEPAKAKSSVSYLDDIEPLLQVSCAHATCHLADGPAEDLILQPGYPYGMTINIQSLENPDLKLIEPGDPERSYLWRKVRGTHIESGGKGERMPWGVEPLTEAQIAMIATWIKDCTPRN